ncbi:YgdB family protein [Gibbsiella quercinecans]|uniref:YgdB family protein n=1 Tax=Gibbsiella quercinecans TaxID=929813 RepID=UPI000EF16778|nr:YgdB family protein [Gibbsiella quercinecans]RLM08812.1 hypothetical protein BIY31_10690 [Gibbsiella quercinecans]
MNVPAQQGGSTLAAVLLLLAMGLMLLTAQQRQLDNALLMAADQQQYLRAYNQAASALAWGLTQRWPQAELRAGAWHCRQQGSDNLKACARPASREGVVVLRGMGEMRNMSPFWLYALTVPGAGDLLIAEPGGWLDFCPEKNAADCDG